VFARSAASQELSEKSSVGILRKKWRRLSAADASLMFFAVAVNGKDEAANVFEVSANESEVSE
jgi:hypothetical protein